MRMLFITKVLQVVSLAFACVFATGGALARTLVPYKRAQSSVVARNTWKRDIVPKDVVRLDYTKEAGQYPSTSLHLTAHREIPIVVLEDIDHLFRDIHCQQRDNTADIELWFDSDDAQAQTMEVWSGFDKFVLVTSHTSCNPSNTRGAWMVSGVHILRADPTFGLTLQADPIPLKKAGSSIRLKHLAENVGSSWRPSVQQRSVPPRGHSRRLIDEVFTLGHDFDFNPRETLFPIQLSLDNKTLLTTGSGGANLTALTETNLEVTCVNCVSKTNFSIGLDIAVDSSGTSLDAATVNITVQEFQHNIQLELALNSSTTIGDVLDVVRVALPDLGISIPDIGDIGFFVGASIIMDLETFGSLNFSIGAKTSIPQGASATFDMKAPRNSSATGWDQATFDIIPFRLNGGELNVTAGISLSPFIEASINVLNDISADARIYVNTPHVSAAASIKTNVNRECQPIGPEDFESFSAALTFGAGINFTIQATSDGDLLPDEDVDLFTRGAALGDLPTIDSPACFIVADDNTASNTITLVGQVPAATGTLIAAAVAVPTFDVSKIEAYYSAHGALPTNVNYTQMAEATPIPADLQKAVSKAAGNGDNKTTSNGDILSSTGSKGILVLSSVIALILL